MTKPRHAPIGAAWSIHHKGASRCLDEGCNRSAPFHFYTVQAKNGVKMKINPAILAVFFPFGQTFCVGAVFLIVSSAQAQNLFVANNGSANDIIEYTHGGAQSIALAPKFGHFAR